MDPINYAIIAAGEGSRLAQEGVKGPKPLVKVGGIPLIGRLVRIFSEMNPSSINIIINEEQPETLAYLEGLTKEIPLNIIVKSTPGSMHSFYELLPFLKSGPCCLTTVDPIFNETTFFEYVCSFISDKESDALMAVTSFIDDEKPLYVKCTDKLKVTGYSDKDDTCKYVSGGIYCFRSSVYPILEKSIRDGVVRMRDFQRNLLKNSLNVKAFIFDKIIDIDHADDIIKAELFLKDIYASRQ